MTCYSFLRYLSYRRKAKGRHGTHSPFIYALIEACINRDRHQPLLARIRAYFRDWEVIELDADAATWSRLPAAGSAERPRLYIVPGIYRDAVRTRAWRRLRGAAGALYSIDLFHFGLLLVHPDFREQQHFILKG